MLKRSLTLLLLAPGTARAIDSHQVASMATMAANMYTGGAFSSVMGSVAGMGFDFGAVLNELGVDQTADTELQKSLNRIEILQSQMTHFRDSGVRMKSLSDDMRSSRNLSDRMRILKTMIQISKSLATVMKGSPELGERAFKVQDVRLNYMILDELMAMRRMQYEESLKSREKQAQMSIMLAGVNEEERAYKARSKR